MDNEDIKKSHTPLSKDHISPKDPKWLAEIVEEVNQSFNEILKLIEQDEEPFAEKSDVYYKRKPKLIAHVEVILHKHQLLATQYDQLLRDSVVGFPKGSSFESLDPSKVECEVSSPDSSLRSDGESSEISSDSDSESYKSSANKSSRSPFDAGKLWEHNFVDAEKEIDLAEVKGRTTKYEEELRVSNQKLQLSEEQVVRLKKEIEEIAGSFQSQLESAESKIQEREADLQMEKKKVMDYTQQLKNQLESAQQEVVLLETELGLERKQALVAKDTIQQYQTDLSKRDNEIKKLGAALEDATEKFFMDEAQLQSHVSTLSEHLMLVEARAEEWEMRSKSLEGEIQQREAVIAEMRRLHEAQEMTWKNEFDYLKAELNVKDRVVDLLNKDLDGLKRKYDELMTEKDGAIAKIHTLGAQLGSSKNEVRQMEDRLHQLHLENIELISAMENSRKQYEDLSLRVQELEKEVEMQKVVISDRAEEKREAIRQLCFSMEHYRNGYEELRQAYSGYKRHIVMAS